MKRGSGGILRAGLLAAAGLLLAAEVAAAEVQLFIDKFTVRVMDPTLGRMSVLNDFRPQGWKTHNNLALVWNDRDTYVYDVRTHQWLPLLGFAPQSGMLSDEAALVWAGTRAAIYDARERRWIQSPFIQGAVRGPFLSRGLVGILSELQFVVYDPVLREWRASEVFDPRDAQISDNLVACWGAQEAQVYDLTMHQWMRKVGIRVQAAIVEEYRLSLYTADSIFVWDALTHRWSEQAR
jgi:hypothetical protein